ncbi:MAG: hypothetical protein U1E34_11240 [Amaricoccus sp.]
MDRLQRAGWPFHRAAVAIRAHPVAARWILAGPVALVASLATMMAMPLWVPAGAAGVNDIALPLVLLPLIWAAPFFYACLEPDLARGAVLLSVIALGQAAPVAVVLLG